jgi:hypothetical protein
MFLCSHVKKASNYNQKIFLHLRLILRSKNVRQPKLREFNQQIHLQLLIIGLNNFL